MLIQKFEKNGVCEKAYPGLSYKNGYFSKKIMVLYVVHIWAKKNDFTCKDNPFLSGKKIDISGEII